MYIHGATHLLTLLTLLTLLINYATHAITLHQPTQLTICVCVCVCVCVLHKVTEDLADQVQEVIHESEAKRYTATASALDFDYLVGIDRDTRTAAMRFQLDADEQIPETLFLIQLVHAPFLTYV